jgi:pyrroline-5-carboxylate reductase
MKISVIGAGAMGGALIRGLINGETFKTSDITVADCFQESLEKFTDTGISLTTDNTVAAEGADIVIIVVKPWLVENIMKEIKPVLDYKRQIVIFIAAGIKCEQINSWLNKGDDVLPALFSVIPNIAIAVMNSMTFIAPCNANEKQIAFVKSMFDEMGGSLIIEERLMAAGTTLASCGIAYAMRYVRASVEGGVELGFKAKDAEQIVLQTVKGAVELLQTNGNHPEAEIDKVTTPGGVTIKGLNEMEHAGFTSAVIRGLKAGLK